MKSRKHPRRTEIRRAACRQRRSKASLKRGLCMGTFCLSSNSWSKSCCVWTLVPLGTRNDSCLSPTHLDRSLRHIAAVQPLEAPLLVVPFVHVCTTPMHTSKSMLGILTHLTCTDDPFSNLTTKILCFKHHGCLCHDSHGTSQFNDDTASSIVRFHISVALLAEGILQQSSPMSSLIL